jgi:hypothetical protein
MEYLLIRDQPVTFNRRYKLLRGVVSVPGRLPPYFALLIIPLCNDPV